MLCIVNHNRALSTEPKYQFDQSSYVTTEGPNARIRVVVQQIVQSVRDIHLLLTPLTYAQYIAHSNQPRSTLAPIDQFHGSRPSNAHCKELKLFVTAQLKTCSCTLCCDYNNIIIIMVCLPFTDEDDRHDFNNSVQSVVFPANSGVDAERRVDFPVFDDVADEDPEGFIIVLDVDRNLTDFAVAFTPNLRTTLGRIKDDDR